MVVQKLKCLFVCVLFTAVGSAAPIVYVVNGQQFGTVDVGSGAFSAVGPGIPEGTGGLVPGPNVGSPGTELEFAL